MRTYRITVLGFIALAAIGIYVFMEPEPPEAANISPTNYNALVDAAMSDFDFNDALAESAPQQQVVSGWVARDLLQIQALELADLLDAVTEQNRSGQLVAATDPRVPALLGLGVIAICLLGITMPSGESRIESFVGQHAGGDEGAAPA